MKNAIEIPATDDEPLINKTLLIAMSIVALAVLVGIDPVQNAWLEWQTRQLGPPDLGVVPTEHKGHGTDAVIETPAATVMIKGGKLVAISRSQRSRLWVHTRMPRAPDGDEAGAAP